MVPDCTAVHTARGPTPRKRPLMPSVRYMMRNPVMTEDVSSVAAACGLTDVDGDEVEILRVEERREDFGCGVECLMVVVVAGCDEVWCISMGWTCVCILVLTTSSGQVITPAIQPAEAAVKISSGRPMSLLPTQARASFCSCS